MNEQEFETLFWIGFIGALSYLFCVFRFFAELQKNDNDRWLAMGSPELKKLQTFSQVDFLLYFKTLFKSFFDSRYLFAKPAVILLCVFVPYFLFMFFMYFRIWIL